MLAHPSLYMTYTWQDLIFIAYIFIVVKLTLHTARTKINAYSVWRECLGMPYTACIGALCPIIT